MSLNYKVATYNAGTNRDYEKVHHEEELLRDEKLGKAAFRALSEIGIDFFCLQEAFTHDLGDVFFGGKTWITDNYDYIQNKKGVALVWNNKQFKLISGSIKRTEDYLVADLYDATNNKIIRLASIHIPGYSIEHIQTMDAPEAELQMQHQAVDGLMGALKSDNRAYFTIIGSDTNSVPSIYPGFHQKFESAGYSYDKKDSAPTNIHEKEGFPLKERQLDFIFKSDFVTAEKLDQPDSLTLKNIENPSDHAPVIHSMTISFFTRLLKFLYNFFTWKPSIKIDENSSRGERAIGINNALNQTPRVAGRLSDTVRLRE